MQGNIGKLHAHSVSSGSSSISTKPGHTIPTGRSGASTPSTLGVGMDSLGQSQSAVSLDGAVGRRGSGEGRRKISGVGVQKLEAQIEY